jgi:alpha-acetolactate decarboxylase
MAKLMLLPAGLALVAGVIAGCSSSEKAPATPDGELVQYGTMHEAIGQQQHEGRVRLGELVAQPHFYGVAALARLEGEVTVHDGKVTVTRVGEQHRLLLDGDEMLEREATLVVGAHVSSWTEHELPVAIVPGGFDRAVAEAATRAGIDTSKPFVFTVEGQFSELDFHVINGACPMRARLKRIELPEEQRPVERKLNGVRGTIVGIYAEGAVGELTHPDTTTHAHVLYEDPASGETFTGHIEQVGLAPGAVLRLPA